MKVLKTYIATYTYSATEAVEEYLSEQANNLAEQEGIKFKKWESSLCIDEGTYYNASYNDLYFSCCVTECGPSAFRVEITQQD